MADSPTKHQHVVMFSGGIGSWVTAKRVVAQHGKKHLTLLFADTRVEDADTYRFLRDAAKNAGGKLVTVEDGRTPFEVFKDDRFLGNHRLANCSKYLKQIPCRRWVEANCDPEHTTIYVGIDWSEIHRLPAIRKGWAPYTVEAPMTERPYLGKAQMVHLADDLGLVPPAAYAKGMPHANCLAQGCVRGGMSYWQNLLVTDRETYLRTEADEEGLREYLDADVAILSDRTGGDRKPITLRAFRERIEQQGTLFDGNEWGGCGCFTNDFDLIDIIDEALSDTEATAREYGRLADSLEQR